MGERVRHNFPVGDLLRCIRGRNGEVPFTARIKCDIIQTWMERAGGMLGLSL